MLLKIHRGAHDIGGTCIELEHENSRIVIDIGMPLYDRAGQKFDMNKYQDCSDKQLIREGVLPAVSGLYHGDTQNKPVDGVLISHAHMDHYGLYRFINKDICCYAGAGTKKLIDLTAAFTPYSGALENCTFIHSGVPFSCGSFSITPYLMDHSAFDAYAFLIETREKKVIYSGDFRDHGRKAKAFYWFLHNAPRKVDALLLEGTMFGRTNETVKTENEIESKIAELLRTTPRIAFIYTSGQNIDRLVSFYKAACQSKRFFVIDIYTAIILDELKEYASLPHAGGGFANIKIFYPQWLCRRMIRQGQGELMARFRHHEIKVDEIAEKADKIVMMSRASMLQDIGQITILEGGAFIYSMWGGYMREKSMEPMLDRIKENNLTFHSIHTSGHASIQTLKRVVRTLQPKRIIPIHTFHPEQYDTMGSCIEVVGDGACLRL